MSVGGGFCFSKPSQAWCSPRLIRTVAETVAANRCSGQTLSRYLLQAG